METVPWFYDVIPMNKLNCCGKHRVPQPLRHHYSLDAKETPLFHLGIALWVVTSALNVNHGNSEVSIGNSFMNRYCIVHGI